MHLGCRRGDEEAGHSPCLREAAQGTVFKIQGCGRKVLTNNKGWAFSGCSNLGPGQGVSCRMEGGSFPPAWRTSGLGLVLSSVPNLSKDAQDEQGGRTLTLALQDLRTSLKEHPGQVPLSLSWASELHFPQGCGLCPSGCNATRGGGGRRDSFMLASRRRAFRSRAEAILLSGVVIVICWLIRNTVSLCRLLLSHTSPPPSPPVYTCSPVWFTINVAKGVTSGSVRWQRNISHCKLC